MTDKLAADARAAALERVPDWTYLAERDAISRVFTFTSFVEAFGFMAQVALLAEKAGHHPDWSNSYSRVEITLSTHDAGGLSDKDIALATAIDGLVGGT